MDHIVELPELEVFETILIIVCHLTKQAIFIPCCTTNNASEFAKLFFEHIFSKHRLLNNLVSDGVVGLAALLLIIHLILRHRRNREKDLFDGNFDPAHVVAPTAPRISLLEDDNGDDGMGGRLGTGVGGVVTPFQYVLRNE
ncbi:hypothetical protein C0993_011958 [Termitomyces sp. T159_Od127]|nr:hypothetical protein C0993_011958 [Termitomyces sp. T159_Od127]